MNDRHSSLNVHAQIFYGITRMLGETDDELRARMKVHQVTWAFTRLIHTLIGEEKPWLWGDER